MKSLAAFMLVLGSLLFPFLARSEGDSCLHNPSDGTCYGGLPAPRYQALLDEMLLYPHPSEVIPLPPNQEQLDRFRFRKLVNPNGTDVFDAPEGNWIRHIDPGFNFVSVYRFQDGWIEINMGEWVRSGDTEASRPSRFAGVLLKGEDFRYPFAWLLKNEYPSVYPGLEGDPNRERLRRYTRVNIFETVVVDGWEWYLIGPETWIKQTSVARIVFAERPADIKGRWVAVDLYEQVLVAYEGDKPVFATLISSGLPQWSTNEGTFRTWARISLDGMQGAEGQTDFYSLESVPWTLYFDNAISLHGAYWHDGFGYRRSHGCVNMSLTDSYWLYHWTFEGGYEKPWVHVFSSGDYITG